MTALLNLLKDGNSRSINQLAEDLGTTSQDILRKIEFLEKNNIIRKLKTAADLSGKSDNQAACTSKSCNHGSCGSCKGCSGSCGCSDESTFKNMNVMWEVIDT